MSWHYSQALVAAYSADSSADSEPCAPSSMTHTHGMFWSPDKTTDASTRSRSGMTYAPSTGSHGADVLTWCLEASPVRTSVLPGEVLESKANDPASGGRWRESSVKWCRASCSWKTHLCLWEEDLDWSSVIWPKWGMMRHGVLWERVTLPLLTNAKGSGFGENWPTPDARDSQPEGLEAGKRRMEKYSTCGLQTAVHLWPTPQAHKTTESGEIVNADGTPWDGRSKPHSKTTGRPITTALADAVRFATPQARDFRTGSTDRWDNPARSRNLNDQIGGQLNPTWVEWLMGWPLGWTDCAASATDKFRQWCASHGIS
jgi:hypothetical protein